MTHGSILSIGKALARTTYSSRRMLPKDIRSKFIQSSLLIRDDDGELLGPVAISRLSLLISRSMSAVNSEEPLSYCQTFNLDSLMNEHA